MDVTFYLSRSFGIEDFLEDAGIKFPAPMYTANIPCNESEPFSPRMVVSEKSGACDLVQVLFVAISGCWAPAYKGDPTDMGISDKQSVKFWIACHGRR